MKYNILHDSGVKRILQGDETKIHRTINRRDKKC